MISPEMLAVENLLATNGTARQALDLLRRESSGSGWAIAKQLRTDTDSVSEALSELQRNGLVQALGGDGLDGFYHLTSKAFLRYMA